MGKLYLLSGDYIENSQDKDAIVNAANPYMINGSGICGVIYKNAGSKLLNYCKQTYKILMKTAEVRITPGFDLNMDIIHVLAPKHYETKNPIEELLTAYKNMLETIIKHGYKNILVCSLGTGVYGYKHEEVAIPLITLLNDFCQNNEVNIYLNNMYPIYKDEYLKPFLEINSLNLKKDLSNKEPKQILNYLKENNLIENNIKNKYNNFVKNKELDDMCLSEKIICLQYTLENFGVTKDQIKTLIDSL